MTTTRMRRFGSHRLSGTDNAYGKVAVRYAYPHYRTVPGGTLPDWDRLTIVVTRRPRRYAALVRMPDAQAWAPAGR